MTPTTPTGIALHKLRQLVSEAPAFQIETETHSAAGALNYIFAPEKRNESDEEQAEQCPRAFAVITLPENSAETDLIAGGGANYFTLRGTLELQLVRQIEDFANLTDELTAFLNFSEGVWQYLIDSSAVRPVDGPLAITNLPRTSLAQTDEKHVAGYRVQKPIHKAVYQVSWGNGGQ